MIINIGDTVYCNDAPDELGIVTKVSKVKKSDYCKSGCEIEMLWINQLEEKHSVKYPHVTDFIRGRFGCSTAFTVVKSTGPVQMSIFDEV